MNRSTSRALAAGALLTTLVTLCAPPADAQQVPADCTYDTCALRIKSPTMSTPRLLVRGQDDEEVVRLGLMEPAVAPFVQLSDSAAAYARTYDVLYDRGSIITIVGTALAIGAPIVLGGTMQKIGFTVAGVAISIYGGLVTNQANEALSSAVWWYNRELPRTPDP